MTILLDSIALDRQGYVDDSGFWHTVARFARAGIQTYSAGELVRGGATQFSDLPPTEPVRVLRPESAVFDAESMRTFEHLPLTVEHEGGAVTPENAKGTTVGASKAPVVRDNEDRLSVPVVIYDSATIKDAQSKERNQLSAGSRIDIERGGGADDKFGEYDAVITSIRGNHISVVRSGKAGPEFTLGDSKKMSETRTHRGIAVSFDSQGAQAYDAIVADLETVTKKLEEANAALEKMTTERDQLQAKVDVADSAAPDLDALVAERAEVLDAVRKIVPDVDPTGKSNADLRREAAAVAYPAISMDGKSDDYVAAMFDAAVVAPRTVEAHDAVTKPATGGQLGIAETARKRFIEERSGR